MRLGKALVENRAKDEVKYYDRQNRTGSALYPPRLGRQAQAGEAESHGSMLPRRFLACGS